MRVKNKFKVSEGQSLCKIDYKVGGQIHICNKGDKESLCGVQINIAAFDLHILTDHNQNELREASLDYICLHCIAKERRIP